MSVEFWETNPMTIGMIFINMDATFDVQLSLKRNAKFGVAIFLFCCATFSVSLSEAIGKRCAQIHINKKLVLSKQSKLRRLSLGDEKSPVTHTFELGAAILGLRSENAFRILQYDIQGSKFLYLQEGLSFVEESFVTGPSSYLVARDIDGNLFRIEAVVLQKQPTIYKANMKDMVPVKNSVADDLVTRQASHAKRIQQASGFPFLSKEKKAELLSALQLASSTNASGKEDAFSKGILQANLLFMEIFDSDSRLTIEHLSKINLLVTEGRTVLNRSDGGIYLGIPRGTSKVVRINGENVIVDNTQVQVHQSRQHFNSFAPAEQVPIRLNELIENVNALNKQSKLVDIFDIFRNFIKIHPFVDGNGRSARTLLNFMLLKSGFPPMPITSESLYFSSMDLAQRYLNIILNRTISN